jgi:hypothetical protein
VPTTVHCDHLIAADSGNKEDLAAAKELNEEVCAHVRMAETSIWLAVSAILPP